MRFNGLAGIVEGFLYGIARAKAARNIRYGNAKGVLASPRFDCDREFHDGA
jgi:hypothetical protein